MDEDFDIDNLSIKGLYVESEQTKLARHKYYKTKSKLSIYKLIPIPLLITAIICFIYYFIEFKNNYKILLGVAIFLLILSIIIFIILAIVQDNILKPMEQDIKRSVINDQLSFTQKEPTRRNSKQKENNNYENQIKQLTNEIEELKNENTKLKNKYKNQNGTKTKLRINLEEKEGNNIQNIYYILLTISIIFTSALAIITGIVTQQDITKNTKTLFIILTVIFAILTITITTLTIVNKIINRKNNKE